MVNLGFPVHSDYGAVKPRFTAGVGGRQKPAVNRVRGKSGFRFLGSGIGQKRWERPLIHIRDIFDSLTIVFSKLIVSKC